MDYNEDPRRAVLRELEEETNLQAVRSPAETPCSSLSSAYPSLSLVAVSGRPNRDPRGHTCTIMYAVKIQDFSTLKGGDDAKDAKFFRLEGLLKKRTLAFDHAELLVEFVEWARNNAAFFPQGKEVANLLQGLKLD